MGLIRRRNYFIKKEFQLKFLAGFVILLVIAGLLVLGLFLFLSRNTITTGYANSSLRIERTSDFFLLSFILATLVVMLGVTIAGLFIFIVLSHRLAGPLYRFESALGAIGKGDLTTRVNLRRTDQVTEMRDALNNLTESFDEKLSKIKNLTVELRILISKKDIPGNITKINNVVDLLDHEVEYFKVSQDRKE